jgi:hypothetical protein
LNRELTEHEQEQIAGLHGYPPFEALLVLFRDFEDGLLEELRYARGPELERTAYFWQLVTEIRHVLAGHPENLSAALAAKREFMPLGPPTPSQLMIERARQRASGLG